MSSEKTAAAEAAVRKAAVALCAAIVEARKAGLSVVLPSRVEGLEAIEVSSTGKAHVSVEVSVSAAVAPDVAPDVAARAGAAAQKAADRVIEKAEAPKP